MEQRELIEKRLRAELQENLKDLRQELRSRTRKTSFRQTNRASRNIWISPCLFVFF